MLRFCRTLFLVSLLAVAGIVVNFGAASAATSIPATSLGVDVSFPQCGATLPTPVGFGVVGVNNGRPFTANPCLAVELAWAQTTVTASPAFYANTADPGPLNNPSWPTSQETPQACAGDDSIACSYDWGWNAAQNSFQNAVAAETQLGVSSPSTAAAAVPWWLDVETANSWESLRTGATATSAQRANDLAVVQGEVASFASLGVSAVGIYSTSYQWSTIVGSSGTSLAANNVWLPGYATLTQAQAACTATSFSGGRVAMIQYPSNGLDGDYVCPFESTPTSAYASVASSASFTDQLSVTGERLPVTYVQTSGSPSLNVSSTGVVTTSGQLAQGTYTATGATGAGSLTGTFSFTLSVGLLVQNLPTSASSSVTASATFTDQLSVTGASGTVTFTPTSGTPSLVVSPTGRVSTSGALAIGSYLTRGTTSDPSGDTGTFTFTVVIATIRPATVTPPSARRVVGTAVAGRTVTLRIIGLGFYGRPTVSSHAGTIARVTKDTGTQLVVRVSVRSGSRRGTFTFTITLANKKTVKVHYVQR
jgi:hypothetical protein